MNRAKRAGPVWAALLSVSAASCIFGGDGDDDEGDSFDAGEINGTYDVTITFRDNNCGMTFSGPGGDQNKMKVMFVIQAEGPDGGIQIWMNPDESLPANSDGDGFNVENGQVTMNRSESFDCSVVQMVNGDMEIRDKNLSGEMSMTIFLQGSQCDQMIQEAQQRGDDDIPQEGCTVNADLNGRKVSDDADPSSLSGPGSRGDCRCDQDGCCNNDCSGDPDCGGGEDCSCEEDSCCNPDCPDDPDCGGGDDCEQEDGYCDQQCPGDPDCDHEECGEDGSCNGDCSDDPDCGGGGPCEVKAYNNCSLRQHIWIIQNDCDPNDAESPDSPCKSWGSIGPGESGSLGPYNDGDHLEIGPCDHDANSGSSDCRIRGIDVDCSQPSNTINLCPE